MVIIYKENEKIKGLIAVASYELDLDMIELYADKYDIDFDDYEVVELAEIEDIIDELGIEIKNI
ncbi:MAG: hypothetical protein NC925_02595 [Candidatus Omnitrophica bacterium]|nr:hypothetical protein [Candidatus Omnitrophota bacterium]